MARKAGGVAEQFPSPGTNPRGISWDGSSLWTTDGQGTVYRHGPGGSVLESFGIPAPMEQVHGIFVSSDSIWLSDPTQNRVYRLDLQTHAVVSSFRAPGRAVFGLGRRATNGNLLLSDVVTDRIYEITDTGTVVSVIPSPGTLVHGLTWDSSREMLWVSDMVNRRIYLIDYTTGNALKSFVSPSNGPAGLAYENQDLWHVDSMQAMVYRLYTEDEGDDHLPVAPVISSQRMLTWVPSYYRDSRVYVSVLQAVGAELDNLRDYIKQITDQSFVSKADEWGLKWWEETLALRPDPQLSVQERQDTIQAALRSRGTVTSAVLKNIALSYEHGLIDVVEDYSNYQIIIRFVDELGVPSNLKPVEDAIRASVPAHLGIVYEYNFFTWDNLDDKAWTWDQLDGMSLTWDQLRKYA